MYLISEYVIDNCAVFWVDLCGYCYGRKKMIRHHGFEKVECFCVLGVEKVKVEISSDIYFLVLS